jgi:hypothetical protein
MEPGQHRIATIGCSANQEHSIRQGLASYSGALKPDLNCKSPGRSVYTEVQYLEETVPRGSPAGLLASQSKSLAGNVSGSKRIKAQTAKQRPTIGPP